MLMLMLLLLGVRLESLGLGWQAAQDSQHSPFLEVTLMSYFKACQ